MKTYIGVDNGLKGAVAILRQHEVLVRPLQVYKVEKKTKKRGKPQFETVFDDVWFFELLQAEGALGYPMHVVVERAQKFSPGKLALISTTATWAAIRTVLRLGRKLEIGTYDYTAVDPQQWQRDCLAGIHRADLGDTGPASITAAQRAFPGVSLRRTTRCTTDCDGMADALNMAWWGREKNL